MHRTQILLEPWQHEVLKSMAERQGRSVSELVREILTERLRSDRAKLRRIEGIGEDPLAAAADHDRYLYGER